MLLRSLLILLTLALAACVDPAPQTPRNLLLITLDTVRADHLGVYGYKRSTSPHLDRFAAHATVFEDVTCSMPTTLPSHLTIFTGLPPSMHGVRRNGEMPPGDIHSIFVALAARGYHTAAVVSAGVLHQRFLDPLDFAEFYYDQRDPDSHQVSAEVVNHRVFSWLDQHPSDEANERPFALWLHYYDAHEPYNPPADFAARFKGDYNGLLGDELLIPWLATIDQPEVRAGLDKEDLQHIVNLYDAEVAYLDTELGRLFNRLEEEGLLENTLVVIVGDHGQALGENDFFGHGERLLEPVIQIPLIVRLPGQQTPQRISASVESTDLAPTLRELFNLEWKGDLPGRSLVSALRGDDIESVRLRLVERRSYPGSPERRGIAVHLGQRKWTWYRETDGSSRLHLGRRDGEGGLDGENFYDPSSAEAQRLIDFLARRDGLLGARGENSGEAMSEETLQMLRSLGYIQ